MQNEGFNLDHWSRDWFLQNGFSENTTSLLTLGVDILIILLISFIVDFIARKIILNVVSTYVKRSKNEYDDIFLEKRVFSGLAHLAPAFIIFYSIPWLFDDTNVSIGFIQKIIAIYVIINILMVAQRFLKSLEHIALQLKRFRGKPVSSYIQLFTLIVYLTGGVVITSMLIGKSPITILTAFGAATAVLLLIFKDTILGLVASIQISANDTVRLGDWVSMDKYGADGNIIEINLTTVKVKNWDKTITMVPTYAFVSDAFKNWRGMETSGVRRIKRSIKINVSSIKFVDQAMLERFVKYERVSAFVKSRQEEIETFNNNNQVDKSELINGRHMTNIGVFRRYALSYLENHPKIDQKETVMVRQLEPTKEGLPIEIYAFVTDIAWVNYENIQSDIFDHLLTAVKNFELTVFQNPSGADFQKGLNL